MSGALEPKQNDEVICPKCYSRSIFKRWHLTGYPTAKGPYCYFRDYNRTDKEHLHYYCRECGYDWVEEIK